VLPFPAVILFAIPWDFILILIALGALVPWRGAIRIRRLLAQPALTTSQRLSLYASTIVFQWLIVAVISWRAFARHLNANELGLVVSGVLRTFLIALILTALLCLNQWASLRRIARVPADRRGFLFRFTEKIMPQTSTETFVFVALACTAGLSEEFAYRGFVFAVISRAFADSASSASIAMVISSAWFAVAHLYQGRRGMITTFVVGLLFSGIRIWSGNLVPEIAGHIGVDLVAGLYAPRLILAQHGPQTPVASGDGERK
jgi:membrane protease YdiL (CAAX protease family)